MYSKIAQWSRSLQKDQTQLKKHSQVKSLLRTIDWGASACDRVIIKSAVDLFIKKHSQSTSLNRDELSSAKKLLEDIKNNIEVDPKTLHAVKKQERDKAYNLLLQNVNNNHTVAVFDLEMTCSADNSTNHEPIDIGVQIINLMSGETLAAYSTLILPTIDLPLTEFCTNLTGITTRDIVTTGKSFRTAMTDFELLLEEYEVTHIIQWGGGDYSCLKHSYKRHKIDTTFIDKVKPLNLKSCFALSFGTTTRLGLRKALNIAGITRLSVAHRALPDAIETGKLAQEIFNRGFQADERH